MSKISKVQAEAAWQILNDKIQKLREEKKTELVKTFKERHPEEYAAMEEYCNLMDAAEIIKKNFILKKYTRFWGGSSFEHHINTCVGDELHELYPNPDYSTFVNTLLIQGEADILAYIDEYLNKFVNI